MNPLSFLVPVRRSELAGVVLLALNAAILVAAYGLTKVVRVPLFLIDDGAPERQAYAAVASDAVMIGVVPLFGVLVNRATRLQLVVIVQLVEASFLLALYALGRVHAPIGLALYVAFPAMATLSLSNFWSFAADIYTREQGVRVFVPIGLGAGLGGVLGGYLPALLHHHVGYRELLLVAAGGLVASVLIYALVERVVAPPATSGTPLCQGSCRMTLAA